MIEPDTWAKQEVDPVLLVNLKVVNNPFYLKVAPTCIFDVLDNIETNFVQKWGQNGPS